MPGQTFAPWVGAGLLYEWTSVDVTTSVLGVNASSSTTVSGILPMLQAGGDIYVAPKFILGPFVEGAFGRYDNASNRTQAGNLVNETDGDITNTAWHTWVTLGVRGAFDSAIGAIRHLQAEGIRVSANTQIARPALREIEPLLDRLMDEGIRAWQVSMTVPMGRAADEPDLLLQPYQVLEVLPMVARIEKKARARGVDVTPGNDIGYTASGTIEGTVVGPATLDGADVGLC